MWRIHYYSLKSGTAIFFLKITELLVLVLILLDDNGVNINGKIPKKIRQIIKDHLKS